jgi:hypothetical protein
MATLRTVINRVLGAIGETQITPATTVITDTYQLQVLEFINQIKEEIEGTAYWRSLWTTITGVVLTSTNSIALSGTNERSDLIRIQDTDNGQFVPLFFNVTTAATPLQCTEEELSQLLFTQAQDPVTTATGVTSFALHNGGAGTLTLQIYPKASGAQSFSGTFYVPQAALTANDLDTTIKIPERVLVQGTVWAALEERGEELGQSGMWTEERFRRALDDATSQELTEQGGLRLVAT